MRNYVSLISYLLLITCLSAQKGTIKESLKIKSNILEKEVEYSVYLPHDYDLSDRSYPVLYLLHGYTDDESGWTQFGEVKKIADSMIGDINVTDMIIAMPDAGLDWYVNSYDGKTRYEDFFIEEFIPYIEQTYKARGTRRYRAIAGLSMGGHGTLIYSLKYPDLFVASCPLSASVWTEDYITGIPQGDFDRYFGAIYGSGKSGQARITEHLKDNATLYILDDADVKALKKVKFYIDCGDDDFLIEGNLELSLKLNKLEIPHEFRIRDGAHNWTYWRDSLPEVLKFVSKSFHQY